MTEIWEHNRTYSLFRPYVDDCIRKGFRYLKYRGADLPEDGAVILAPNHTNTLMDALVILAGRKGPTAFGSRADIFRNPAAARLLHFFRMLPLVRERDGLSQVKENYESFDLIDQTLEHRIPFCVFAEGTHRPGRSLQPIKKGIARIALRSAQARQTWLVPTGINYTDFFRYRKGCEVWYGEPVDVNAFVREHPELNEAQLLQALRSHLEDRMAALVEPQGPAEEKPSPLILLLWPFAALLSFPIWCTAEVLCSKMKDRAWCNSIRTLCYILLLPLTALIWCLLIGLTFSWPAALAIAAATSYSYPLFYDGLNLVAGRTLSPVK